MFLRIYKSYHHYDKFMAKSFLTSTTLANTHVTHKQGFASIFTGG